MESDHRLWFKARRYGWGWTPCSIEGWLVTIATAIALIGGDLAIVFLAADPAEIRWTFGFLPHLPAKAGLIGTAIAWDLLIIGPAIWISWKTGERPRWLWRK